MKSVAIATAQITSGPTLGIAAARASATAKSGASSTRRRVQTSAALIDGSGSLALRAVEDRDGLLRATATPEQHVHRARAAIGRTRGGEREHQPTDPAVRQPVLEPFLQHRDLLSRVATATVHDQHAAMAVARRRHHETLDGVARRRGRHAVQVERRVIRELAVTQPAQDTRVETDDRALDVLARVADVEAASARDEIRKDRERLRFLV